MPEPIYRTDFPSDCLKHDLDGMLLVFHKPSAATHFLAQPVPEMLAILADAPSDAAMLTQRLCDRLGLPMDKEAEAVICQRLVELASSGLIRTA